MFRSAKRAVITLGYEDHGVKLPEVKKKIDPAKKQSDKLSVSVKVRT